MLKKYIVTGKNALNGTVRIAGAKNSALPIFAATLLTQEPVVLHNVPFLRDTHTMMRLLEHLGKKIVRTGSTVTIVSNNQPHTHPIRAKYEIVKQMRASICVLGPLLARYGAVEVALPGGCAFGPRPVDLHLKGLARLGADIKIVHGDINARARNQRLQGATINLLGPAGTSVLATDNVISAAVLAQQTTVIHHVATEPETQDLIHFLNTLGAKITLTTQNKVPTAIIEGVDHLHGGEYTIIPDRIEAGTYMIFAALTGGTIKLTHVCRDHLKTPLALLAAMKLAVHYETLPPPATSPQNSSQRLLQQEEVITIKGSPLADYNPFSLTTAVYPGFPTDLQPLYMVLATVAGKATSYIDEHIYPNRFNHVPELVRMGANITIAGNQATIHPVKQLQSAHVQASDLRAGAALVAAALAAAGTSVVKRIYHVERGYEDMVTKLTTLGADIRLADDTVY